MRVRNKTIKLSKNQLKQFGINRKRKWWTEIHRLDGVHKGCIHVFERLSIAGALAGIFYVPIMFILLFVMYKFTMFHNIRNKITDSEFFNDLTIGLLDFIIWREEYKFTNINTLIVDKQQNSGILKQLVNLTKR